MKIHTLKLDISQNTQYVCMLSEAWFNSKNFLHTNVCDYTYQRCITCALSAISINCCLHWKIDNFLFEMKIHTLKLDISQNTQYVCMLSEAWFNSKKLSVKVNL